VHKRSRCAGKAFATMVLGFADGANSVVLPSHPLPKPPAFGSQTKSLRPLRASLKISFGPSVRFAGWPARKNWSCKSWSFCLPCDEGDE
jgi:hypothetical protein